MLGEKSYSTEIFTDRHSHWIKDLFLIGMGSLLISLSALVSFRVPFTPVAFAMANLSCLCLGATLGPRRGALAALAYLFYGVIGLPVFATGNSGLAYLCGSSGGYLVGYVAGAYLTGYLVQRMQEPSPSKILLALSLGNSFIYLLGALQLSFFIGMPAAITLGVAPFLVTDTLKFLAVSKSLQRFTKAKSY